MASEDPDWKQLHPWWKQSFEIARLNESFCAITPDSPEFAAWMKFFRENLDRIPRFMLLAQQSRKPVTLPSRWPGSAATPSGHSPGRK